MALPFWFSLAVLVYTFAGYPVLMFLLGKLFKRKVAKAAPTHLPSVSVVLVAHNEEKRIAARLENLLASNYPTGQLEIIVVSDGSTDATADNVKSFSGQRVRLIECARRSGKACGLNTGVAAATGEIIVFCDARQRFTMETILELVSNFSDPRVGAVSGNNHIDSAASAVGGGVDLYWRMEKFIRHAECGWDSSIGCTGAIYAIRRKLFQNIADDTILDDVVIPMQIAAQNYRIVFDHSAQSFDPQPNEPEHEQRRKRRTLAGNFQMLFRFPQWLVPWKNRLWWQLISHKYLRIAAPLFLALLFLSNAALIDQPLFRILFLAQTFFYLLAGLGLTFSSIKLPLFSIPAGFCFLNLMTVGGFWNYLRGAYRGGQWKSK